MLQKKLILTLSIYFTSLICTAQNPNNSANQQNTDVYTTQLQEMQDKLDLKKIDFSKIQEKLKPQQIKDALKMIRAKSGVEETSNTNKVIEYIGDYLGPFSKNALYILADERVKVPLKEIYEKQNIKNFFINQIIFIIMFLLIKSYVTSKTKGWIKIILINIFSLFLFWLGMAILVPFTVYGTTYIRLLQGFYHAVLSLP